MMNNAQAGLERCLTFINCQLQPRGGRPLGETGGGPRRAVTISRQSGSGGHAVAERLADYLHACSPGDPRPWTVFDRNLVETVLEDQHLPKGLARFMPEDRVGEIQDMMDELFGLHPSCRTLVRQTADTILHLAELGNVIVIGRGGNVITSKLDYVFHVRLVGSLERRVEQIRQIEGLGHAAALAQVLREDRGRQRYLKKYLNKDIDDPLLYHLIINTDLVPYGEAARMIGEAVIGRKQTVRVGN
jgi:cytidylate kinase